MEKKSIKNNRNHAKVAESAFESSAWNSQKAIIGIDEVGRGCFAGPVVTCALILKPYATHDLLRDSKTLSLSQRNQAAAWIEKNAWYAFGIIDHRIVDEINIYQATLIAMQRAYFGLISILPHTLFSDHTVLVDAMPLFLGMPINVESFIKGEQRSISIAAASIMAKVMRDNLMERLHTCFPSYGLKENKGYGTSLHIQTLRSNGPSIIHRKTFIRSSLEQKAPDHEQSHTFVTQSIDKQRSFFR